MPSRRQCGATALRWQGATFLTALLCAPLAAQIPVLPGVHQHICLPQNHIAPVDDAEAMHVLNRTTFGPTSALLAQVKSSGGWQQFVQQQLNPANIPENPDLVTVLDQLALPIDYANVSAGTLSGSTATLLDLQRARVACATLSHRQLNEVMTEFWENHFNTAFFKHFPYLTFHAQGSGGGQPTQVEIEHMASWFEWQQNQGFRQRALGKFEELLTDMVLSPAMLSYLDMVFNSGCNGNENFAREFLELYTMGQFHKDTGAGNYTQADIDELTKVFSGWGIFQDTSNLVFVAQPNSSPPTHCTTSKQLFGPVSTPGSFTVVAGTPAAELAFTIDKIVAMDATKDFICRKLVAHFVADRAADPGVHDGLLASMKAAWGQDGEIAAVLCVLFSSSVFQGPDYRWQRVRSPLEMIVWNARIWDSQPTSAGAVSFASLIQPTDDVEDLGQGLYTFPSPDGYPLDSVKRLGSARSIESAIAGSDIYRSPVAALVANLPLAAWGFSQTPAYLQYVFNTLPSAADQANPTLVAQALLDRLYPAIATTTDRNEVATMLGTTLNPANITTYALDLARGVSMATSFTYASLK